MIQGPASKHTLIPVAVFAIVTPIGAFSDYSASVLRNAAGITSLIVKICSFKFYIVSELEWVEISVLELEFMKKKK